MPFTAEELDAMAMDMELLGNARCPCGTRISEADKHNAGLCVPCWTYDTTVNHSSNLTRI